MGKSFFEILEDQIRSELREEIRKEIEAEQCRTSSPRPPTTASTVGAMGRLETWLSARLAPQKFERTNDARRAYGATAKPQAPRRLPAPSGERRFVVATSEERIALELLRKYGEPRLNDEFTMTEIKGAWRKAALKTHPDRFSQSDAITQARQAVLFRELCDAYEILTALAETPQAA